MENTKELPKKYVSSTEEEKIMKFWEENSIFTFKKNNSKKIFSIDTPPPTVSGNMHIGHSFSYSQQDFIARYKRLTGFNVFYPFGTDDNGLPTERLVEKTKKVQSTNMTRGEFRDLCYNTINELKQDFIYDWKRLGVSCDFTKSYSTISKDSQKISQKSFIELYKKGLIYEQEAPMTWCTKCQTAIAQAEFESKDISSFFNDIIFKTTTDDGKVEDLIIATTRPEFLPACVALFAHPEDERYINLKGKTATVPLFNYEVPVLFDEVVEKDKGTGLMMVCTFGDKEDIDKWKRYNLPLKIIFTKYGVMNELAGKYNGLKILNAREEIIKDLKENKLLISQKEIVHAVNVHERCGTELEFLKTKQWFISILDKKKELLKQVEKLNWYPEHMKSRMVNWIENLNWDWCISRQRFFGIPFPLWRNKITGEIVFPDESELPVDPLSDFPKNYPDCKNLVPELDIMDTWATSSISPEIALTSYGLDINENMPMSLRPQAHDIIRTWAFYTITRSLYDQKILPWNDILVSGFVMASKGEKMSKSKGNVVSPRDVIQKYSSDVLRFWASGSKLGEDLPYKEQDLDSGNRFVTKLWNSFKFLHFFMQDESLKDFNPNVLPKNGLTTLDKAFLNELNQLIKQNTESYNKYEFDKAKYRLEKFFWQKFCDNYIELVKDRLYKPEIYGVDEKLSGIYTYYNVLKSLVIMVSPITPFISEGIWQYFFKTYETENSIADAKWPKEFEFQTPITNDEIRAGILAQDISSIVRKYKSDNQKSLNTEISLKIFCETELKPIIELILDDLKGTIKSKTFEFVDKKDLRGDIEIGESLSETKEIIANEKDIPSKVDFFAIDIDILE